MTESEGLTSGKTRPWPFNPYSDHVVTKAHLENLGQDFPRTLGVLDFRDYPLQHSLTQHELKINFVRRPFPKS